MIEFSSALQTGYLEGGGEETSTALFLAKSAQKALPSDKIKVHTASIQTFSLKDPGTREKAPEMA